MSEVLNVAIVGCGTIGRVHADAIGCREDLVVSALVDWDAAAAEALAERIAEDGAPRPRTYRTVEEALRDAAIDLVAITTPSGLHVDTARLALESGKHVVIEKPLDVDVDRGRELLPVVRAARERGLLASVISQHRFDPSSVVVHDAIAGGRFGRLTSALASVAWWRSQEYYDSGSWRGTWELDGGGALMNQSVHTVDLLLWMMGRPVEIFGWTALLAHSRIEVEDTAVAVIRFESGALASVHATTAAYPGPGNRIQVMGDRGSATIDADVLTYFHAGSDSLRPTSTIGTSFPEGNQVSSEISAADNTAVALVAGHTRQYDDIVQSIREKREPRVTVESALHALATVKGVYLSARSGRVVRFDDILAGTLTNSRL